MLVPDNCSGCNPLITEQPTVFYFFLSIESEIIIPGQFTQSSVVTKLN